MRPRQNSATRMRPGVIRTRRGDEEEAASCAAWCSGYHWAAGGPEPRQLVTSAEHRSHHICGVPVDADF